MMWFHNFNVLGLFVLILVILWALKAAQEELKHRK